MTLYRNDGQAWKNYAAFVRAMRVNEEAVTTAALRQRMMPSAWGRDPVDAFIGVIEGDGMVYWHSIYHPTADRAIRDANAALDHHRWLLHRKWSGRSDPSVQLAEGRQANV